MIKSVIYNPFGDIPKSEKSHVRGWSLAWQSRLSNSNEQVDIADKDTNIHDYDKIYIDLGVNFSGSLNLFGGFNDYLANKCKELIKFYDDFKDIYLLDHEPNTFSYEICESIRNRKNAKTTSSLVNDRFVDELEDCLIFSDALFMHDLIKLNKYIFGDSHSIAFSNYDHKIDRNDGLTLHRILELGLKNVLYSYINKCNEIDLCLGSVDIRHHVLRHDICPKEFAKQYAEQVIEAQDFYEVAINVCAPVPIEYEERKIPKTGQYKGTNFYGSRQERLDFTLKFIETLDLYCTDFDLIMPPDEWYTMNGEEYAKKYMEIGGSVHIAPKFYRCNNWGEK